MVRTFHTNFQYFQSHSSLLCHYAYEEWHATSCDNCPSWHGPDYPPVAVAVFVCLLGPDTSYSGTSWVFVVALCLIQISDGEIYSGAELTS